MKYFNNLVLLIVATLMSLCVVSCDESSTDEPIVDPEEYPVVTDGSLTLIPSDDYFEIEDGESTTVSFTALYGVEDVTNSTALFIVIDGNGYEVDEFEYELDKEGTYEFFADYTIDNTIYRSESVEVEVEAVEVEDPSEDPDAVYASYVKRTIALQFTGTWCGYCPNMIKIMHQYMDSSDGDNVVFVVAHSGDIMGNDYATNLISYNSSSGFPDMRVGSTYFLGQEKLLNYEFSYAYELFCGYVDSFIADDAKTGIGASSSTSSTSIDVDVEIEVGQSGEFGVGVMILEDGVYAAQSNYYSSSDLDITNVDIDNHDACLAASSPATKPFYELLGDSEEHKAGETYTYSCSFDLNDLTSMQEIENCRVVVYTYDVNTRKTDNIIQLPVGESKDIEYLD